MVDYSLPVYKLLKSVSNKRQNLDDPIAIKVNELLDETTSVEVIDAIDSCLKSIIISMPNVKKEVHY